MEPKKRQAVYNHDAQMRYLAKLKEIKIRVKPEEYERISGYAGEHGYSVRGFILAAINEKIERG